MVLQHGHHDEGGPGRADVIGDDFVKGLHAKADIDPANATSSTFEDNTIASVNSGYGGSVLLGRSASPCASPPTWAGSRAGWPSILLIAGGEPLGEVRYLAAAFLRLRQKTNLAMLIPGALPQRPAGRSGAWATTSPGCASAPTAAAVGHEPELQLLQRLTTPINPTWPPPGRAPSPSGT